MTYFIRFTTATHTGIHGPFDDIDDARAKITADPRWYINRNGVIVAADDEDEAKDAECIEHSDDIEA
jgi:hypothetical protein